MYLDLAIIGIYMVFLIALGYIFKRFNRNINDYFRNGCQGTWWLVGSSAFVAGISTYTFTGAAGVAYNAGWSVLIIYMSSAGGFLLNALFLAPWFRQMRVYTVPEIIRTRFNPRTEQLFILSTVPIGLLGGSLALYSLGIFAATIFGLNIYMVIIVLGIIVVAYSFSGGSWAVMATDCIQCMILLAVTIVITFLCLKEIGGIGEFFQAIADKGLKSDYNIFNSPERFKNAFTYSWAAAIFLKQLLQGNAIMKSRRYFAVKDGREARKAAFLAFVLMLAGCAFWFIPPMFGRLMFPDEINSAAIAKPAEAAYAIVSLKLLPQGMVGLMIVAMFAATMSSLDSALNSNCAIFIRNIFPYYQKWRKLPELSERGMLVMSRICTLCLGALLLVLALYFASRRELGQFELVLTLGALLGIPIVVPLFLCIFIKKTPEWGAIFSICCGLSSSIFFFVTPKFFDCNWTIQTQIFTNMAVCAGAYLITIPFFRFSSDEYKKRVEEFFIRMKTPVDFEKEVGQANDLSQLKIIGSFAVFIGLFITLLLFTAKDLKAVLCIGFIAAFMLIIGGLMIFAGYKKQTGSETRAGKTTKKQDKC